MRFIFLVLMGLFTATPVLANECPKPGEVTIPLSDALQSIAVRLTFNFDELGGIDVETPMDERLLGQLEDVSDAERDASLLALLQWQTIGTLPLFSITMREAAHLFDTYLDLLDRHGLTEAAGALRMARDAFPIWNVPPRARYAQWSDGRGTVEPVLDAKLRSASEDFMQSMPAIVAKTEEIAARDESFMEKLEAMLAAKDDYDRFYYLAETVLRCLPQTDDFYGAVAELPLPLQHSVHVHLFVLEAGNGSAHQYFYNSTGEGAPQFLATLRALKLDEQADDLAAAMAALGDPYPTDTMARREVILTLDEEQDEALYQPTWIMDTPELYEAIHKLIKETGYWPE